MTYFKPLPLIVLLLTTPALPAFARTAGTVELLEGRVLIIDAKNRMQRIAPNDEILEGQTIVTGRDGELHVRMIDGALIAVRPDSRLKIERYRAEGGDDDGAFFELIKGAMRSITGWIGQNRKENYRIRTITATIGVRGTDHETMVIERNAAARKLFGEPGTYDKVNDGSTILENPFGRTVLEKHQAGFVGFGKKAPRRLDDVPDFFKPSRNDRRIEQRKIELREQLNRGASPLLPPKPGGVQKRPGPPSPPGAAPRPPQKPMNSPRVPPEPVTPERKNVPGPTRPGKEPAAPGARFAPASPGDVLKVAPRVPSKMESYKIEPPPAKNTETAPRQPAKPSADNDLKTDEPALKTPRLQPGASESSKTPDTKLPAVQLKSLLRQSGGELKPW